MSLEVPSESFDTSDRRISLNVFMVSSNLGFLYATSTSPELYITRLLLAGSINKAYLKMAIKVLTVTGVFLFIVGLLASCIA